MKIPDICNVLSSSGKEFSLSHWYSPIIDSLVAKIEVQRKHLFQIFRIYWIDSLFNMQVFWDLRMQWSNCPYFVAKKDLHWIYLVKKGKSGYSCQDAKFRSTPTQCWKEKQQWHRLHFQILINNKHWEIVRLIKKINKKHCTPATTSRPPLLWSLQTPEVFSGANLSFLRFWHHRINLTWQDLRAGKSLPPILLFLQPGQSCSPWSLTHSLQNKINPQ